MPLPIAPAKMAATMQVSQTTAKRRAKKAEQQPAALLKKTPSRAKPVVEQRSNAITKAPPVTEISEVRESPIKVTRIALRRSSDKARLFVLDTNVLLHDPTSLFRFEEHDVFLPMTTLEELDNHKKGTTDVARNARQASRWIDQLIEAGSGNIENGRRLDGIGNTEATGRLFFQTKSVPENPSSGLLQGKPDNAILLVVRELSREKPDKDVVLVSKDINMRIKAAALGLKAEDYFNDKAMDDSQLLYAGKSILPDTFWDEHAQSLESWQEDGRTYYKVSGPAVADLHVNEFVYTADASFVAQVAATDAKKVTLRTIRDFTLAKNALWGIHARNIEQSFALNLLTDPQIDLVTILGQAGTGKTLMTLAAALSQTLDERRYSGIIFTRATVSVGDDIGYLPGTEEEKMTPWMGALEDNLEVLLKTDKGNGGWRSSATSDIVKSRISIKSMSFMRGRTFLNKFLIIDEAQNLSPKQMKTLITRAGPGTKVVCLGNIAQIDTPYLTEGSSGLTYLVERLKGWAHAGHITLERGERSRLAHWASQAL